MTSQMPETSAMSSDSDVGVETALLLTQQEWDDLAHIVEYFRLSTIRATGTAAKRQHALARRIAEANR